MLFFCWSVLVNKVLFTYKGEALFLQDLQFVNKNKSSLAQSFGPITNPDRFLQNRLIEKYFVANTLQQNVSDNFFEQQISDRAKSLNLSRKNFEEAILQSGINLPDFKKILEYQYFFNTFLSYFKNKVVSSEDVSTNSRYYSFQFTRFEISKNELSEKVFLEKLKGLVLEGKILTEKTFVASQTPGLIMESQLDLFLKSLLKKTKENQFTPVLQDSEKLVVFFLQKKIQKEYTPQELKDKSMYESLEEIAASYRKKESSYIKRL